MNETFTPKPNYTLKLGLPIIVSVGVFALWVFGRSFINTFAGVFSPEEKGYSPFFWQEFLLLFFSGTLVIVDRKLGFRWTFTYLSIFAAVVHVSVSRPRGFRQPAFLPAFYSAGIRRYRLADSWQIDAVA